MSAKTRSIVQDLTTIAWITALEGVKTRLMPLVLGLLLFGVLLAAFAGSLSVTEGEQIQAAILGSYLRLTGVLVLTLFVLNAQVRTFSDKGLELILSLPVPRSHYYFGRLAGFCLIALMVALLFAATLLFYAAPLQVALWGLSFFLELLIIVALSLLSLFTFNQVTGAFFTVLAVYLLSRVMTTLILVGQGPILPQQETFIWAINQMLLGLAFFLPDLDRFTCSSWLVYETGSWSDVGFVLGQGLLYLLFLSAAALIDLYRKNL
ncbi:MAG: ABC transporter permease [Magnetococcales bacterium]|nr:ABC transporter permease [Magnetococcales bacterium]